MHQGMILYAPGSEIDTKKSQTYTEESNIKVKDYFQQDDDFSSNLLPSVQNDDHDEYICNLEETPSSSVHQSKSFTEEELLSKEHSQEISDSLQKQSDALMLSKTEQISNLDDIEQLGENSEYCETHQIQFNWKNVKFCNKIGTSSFLLITSAYRLFHVPQG